MCGIYGMIFHSTKHLEQLPQAREFFNVMAHEAVSRGDDAAGAAVITDAFGVQMYKNALPSTKVIRFRRWLKLLRSVGADTFALMGHTRFGTHGTNIIRNAHPFAFERIVGTHNGVIGNHSRFGPTPAFECDSANVLYRLGEIATADWPDFLEALSGSFALAWATPEGFHLARNYSSPCELAYIPEFDATVYASTLAIILAAVHKTGMTCTVQRTFPAGEIWTFRPKTTENTVEQFKAFSSYAVISSPTKLLPAHTRTAELIPHARTGKGKCEVCDDLHESLVDHPAGPVCEECYEELYQAGDLYGADEGLCDLCSRESEVTRLGTTENFLCRWCMAGQQLAHLERKTSAPPTESSVLYCEGCSRECTFGDVGKTIHAYQDIYVCTECFEKWGDSADEVADVLDYIDVN